MKKLKEDYYIPFNLNKIKDDGELKLYSSDRLKEKFYNTLIKSSILKAYPENIETLINENKLVPCFSVGGPISFMFRKFGQSSEKFHNYLAFYDKSDKKIYIILDKNFDRLVHVDNDNIASLVIHEMVHMFSINKPKEFKKIFYNDIYKFYNTLFKIIFDLKEDINFENIYNYLNKLDNLDTISSTKILEYLTIIKNEVKNKTNLNEEILDLRISLIYSFLKMIYFSTSALTSDKIKQYLEILKSIKQTYEKAFDVNITNSFFYQELLVQSEVIAMLSETKYLKNKLNYIIRGCRMIK